MYFVYLPSSRRFLRDRRKAKIFKAKIIHLAQAESLPIVDVSEVFENQLHPLELFADMGRFYGHYNERGYQLASSFVIRSISSAQSVSKVKSF